MKKFIKFLAIAAVAIVALAACAYDDYDLDGVFWQDDMRFISASGLAAALNAGDDLFLLDVRPEANFNNAHMQNAVPVFAMPFETAEQRERMAAALPQANGRPVIIICNAGQSGARGAWQFLLDVNFDMDTVFLLEGGQNLWPYPQFLAN